MRDIALLIFFIGLLALSVRSAFNATVLWAWAGLIALDSYMYGFMVGFPWGTIFALITLGVGELVHAASLMLPGFFGGEEGVTASRTKAPHLFGLDFSSQVQVYYVIAFWLVVAALLALAFMRTPVGRLCNAVRDNPERAEFIGYNPQRVRFIACSVAAMFAGLAGGLHAINYEIVTSDEIGRASCRERV